MDAARWRPLILSPLVIAALVFGPRTLEGQGQRRTEITLSGFPISNVSTAPADFDAGFVLLGSTSWTVDLTRNQGAGGFSPRVTTVNVVCAAPCPASGTLPVGSLEWRRADLGVWNPLSTTPTLVETRTATFNGTNDPWTNSVQWRYALSWTGTPPSAATFNVAFELVVTAP